MDEDLLKELNPIMDEIMETMHQVTQYMIEIGKIEKSGRKIPFNEIENNKIMITLFERIQENYRELSDMIFHEDSYEYEEDNNFYNSFGYNTSAQKLVINNLKSYLKESYEALGYIDIVEDFYNDKLEDSIYKNTEFKNLRDLEYNLQVANLEHLSVREDLMQEEGMAFKTKNYILDYLAEKKFFKYYENKKLEEYTEIFLQKDEKEKDEKQIQKFFELKYQIYYSYLNYKYNGLLQENDIGQLSLIKKCADSKKDKSREMILNMTEFEIDRNIKNRMNVLKGAFEKSLKQICKNACNCIKMLV